MSKNIFERIGRQLRHARQRRAMTQPALARRIGRDPARISELERDLLNNRLGRDRLTLFAEICDVLDLEPILVPRARRDEIRTMLGEPDPPNSFRTPASSAFDDLFVDLAEQEEEPR